MNIAILGFGTVGSHFYELCRRQRNINVKRVLTLRPFPELAVPVSDDFCDVVADTSIDTVLETIGGVEPAFSYVSAAMKSGKNVITANKQLVCEKYTELISLAEENRVFFRFTPAVGGGIPWLPNLSAAAKQDNILSIGGIMNGTTNFVLTEMEKGLSYYGALEKAKKLGYAEADPSSDVLGYDTRRKLTISANIAFGAHFPENEIFTEGIDFVMEQDIDFLSEKGYSLKLYAFAENENGNISASVMPTAFPKNSAEGVTFDAGNIFSFVGEAFGKISFSGAGAGGFPTGANALRDAVSIVNSEPNYFCGDPCEKHFVPSEKKYRWYFRTKCEGKIIDDMTFGEAVALYENSKQSDGAAILVRIGD